MKWLLCVVMVVVAGVVRADEIRWINPQGGDWNEPGNWDLGRVPGLGDQLVFDLIASYVVRVDDPRAGCFRRLCVKSGEVVIDLLGGTLMDESTVDCEEWEIAVEASGEQPVRLALRNGRVSDKVYSGGRLVARGSGSTGELIIESDVRMGLGNYPAILVESGGVVRISGDVSLCIGYVDVQSGGELEVDGSLTDCFRSTLNVDGLLTVGGDVIGSDSKLTGSGFVNFLDGRMSLYYTTSDIGMAISGNSFVWLLLSSGSEIDLSHIGPKGTLRVGSCCLFSVSTISIRLGDANLIVPASVDISLYDSDGYWKFRPRVRYVASADQVSGAESVVSVWKIPPLQDLSSKSVEMVVETPSGASALRWSPAVSGTASLHLLGTRSNWCPADVDLSGDLNFFDVARFLSEYGQQSPWANINNDLRVDFFDVAEFLAVYTGGCP